MEKIWKFIETDPEAVAALEAALGIPAKLCRLLVQRGICTFEEARTFFRPSADHLHDPYLMKDMSRAVDRLASAMRGKEKILLYGDYDVDGTTAVALLYRFLSAQGATVDYYLPDRYREGYGVSMEGIAYARRTGASLIIALDCGIRAVEQVRCARRYGIDFIICDHHLPGPELPEAVAVLDPRRADDGYPCAELSGCGVACKLAQALACRWELPPASWETLLDLLVVSIACDIVPITGENRTLAWLGLQRLDQGGSPGLRALLAASGRRYPYRISDLVFGVGPMINAAGRMGDAGQSVRLLLAHEKVVVDDYVRLLTQQNELRREHDRRLAGEATALFEALPDRGERFSVVLYQPHWHAGVLGIAASRMVERFHRPAVILTRSEQQVVGSARSIRGLDIHEAIHRCRDLLTGFGGHRHAAGLKMPPENVAAFQDRFEAVVRSMLPAAALRPVIEVSAELSLAEITPAFWRILRQFAPFGPGNRNPVFVAYGLRDAGRSRRLRGDHLLLSVRQGEGPVFDGIAFGQGQAGERVLRGEPFDLCFTLEEDHFQGRSRLRLVVKDIRLGRKGGRKLANALGTF